MQVGLVWCSNRFFMYNAPDNGEERVGNGHSQNDDGNDERDKGDAFKPEEGQNSDHVAKEKGAGVSHKDVGRVKIVYKKAKCASDANESERKYEEVSMKESHEADGGKGNGRDTGGQTVQSVDQVDGVRDADDP